MVQVMKKTKVKAAAKAPAVRGKPKAKAMMNKKPASAGGGETWAELELNLPGRSFTFYCAFHSINT
eukprot:8534608-Pyramimonas_sp.AAC.1